MKEIRYIFNVTAILAFVASFVFAYLYFIKDETKYVSEYFVITLVMIIVAEVFYAFAPTKQDVDNWNKEHNK